MGSRGRVGILRSVPVSFRQNGRRIERVPTPVAAGAGTGYAFVMSPLAFALALFAADDPAPAPCVPEDELCEVIDPATGRPRVWPADVQALEEKAFACIHFGGEPSGDPVRQAFVERQMKKACNGVHRALPGLKRKYRRDSVVSARLANIEAYYGGPIP